MRSIRARITAGASVVVLVVLVLISVVLLRVQRSVLTNSLDESVVASVDDLAAEVATGALPDELGSLGDDDTLAQVVVGNEVIAATTNVAGEPAIVTGAGDGVIRTVSGLPTDDSRFRIMSRTLADEAQPTVVTVAASLDDVDESIRVLRRSLAAVVPAVGLALAALIWLLVGRTLRPVEAIRSEVAEIGGGDLHRRVPVPATRDEVSRLATTMNAMLARVETSNERQQRFVADAAHELRSPLARMRAELEVDVRRHPPAAEGDVRSSAVEEIDAMGRLVDDLLLLARSDSGASLAMSTLDLDEVVLSATAGRRVSIAELTPVQVQGNPAALGRAITNVLDNASRHARSSVRVSLADLGAAARLDITDDGPGIPADRRELVFERFTRLDEARTAGTGGAGLGLAIVREIVQAHGGTVTIGDAPTGTGTLVRIELPATPVR